MPTILYGLESLILIEPQVQRLKSFVIQCLRIILGISMWDMKRNTTIRKLAILPRMSTILSLSRQRLLGLLARLDDHRLPKKLIVSAPAGGSRSVGGQNLRWNDLISKDLIESGISDTWYNHALYRTTWHSMCRTKLEDVNKQRESVENVRKDDRKKRFQDRLLVAREALKCDHPGCNFVAETCSCHSYRVFELWKNLHPTRTP